VRQDIHDPARAHVLAPRREVEVASVEGAAVDGHGGPFFRADDASSGSTWTRIAEINSIDGPTFKRDSIDVTNIDSEGGYAEFIASFRDGGELNMDMNFTHDGFEDLKADFEDDLIHPAPCIDEAVPMIVRLPPSSMLRAAPKNRFGR
jgi:hypothetical protein